ncbi:hypothetical protein Droror1_Dr00007340 [Drosera rotundifolia]
MNKGGSASDLIDAKLEEQQLGGSKHCPSCGHKLDGKPDWVGLPAGVKFDPTDQELIEHLEAKAEARSSKSHPLIDEFIPTIEGEDGICYTHPEKLPGVTRDGLSRHFFHRPSKAYTTGTRKRRKIQTECDLQAAAGGETRWHKTGKTRPVMVNGKQKGCKKILVLYTNFGKNRKPEKTNWVMHQYHLGQHEEEKEGELVVSKIFYQTQPRQCNMASTSSAMAAAAGNVGGDMRMESGSCSSSSTKEVMDHHQLMVAQRDHDLELSGVGGVSSVAAAAAAMSAAYGGMDIQQQLKAAEHFGFLPFGKGFDHQAGMAESSTGREVAAMSSATCEEHNPQAGPHHHHPHIDQEQHHPHHHHQMATAAFHISRPSNPISHIISPPPLHHSSINILDDDPFSVSRMMLQNEAFHHQQQQQHQEQVLQQTQQEQHHKVGVVGGRASATGLEEIIMGCTSTNTPSSSSAAAASDIKEESAAAAAMSNQQHQEEADQWLKYSTFWHDPDNPDHHHHS